MYMQEDARQRAQNTLSPEAYHELYIRRGPKW